MLVIDLCRSPIARCGYLRRLGQRMPNAIPSAARRLFVAHVAQVLGSDDGQAAQRIRALSKPCVAWLSKLWERSKRRRGMPCQFSSRDREMKRLSFA